MHVAYPAVILGIAAAIATKSDAIDTNFIDRITTFINTGPMRSTCTQMTMITAQWFCRGRRWASLRRHGRSNKTLLLD